MRFFLAFSHPKWYNTNRQTDSKSRKVFCALTRKSCDVSNGFWILQAEMPAQTAEQALFAAVESEHPNLVVLTGAFPNEAFSERMDALDLPWMFVPSAADDIERKHGEAVLAKSHSVVFGSDCSEFRLIGSDGKIRWLFLGLPTRRVHAARGTGFACLDHAQVEGYIQNKWTVYGEEETFATLLFVHDPLPEHLHLLQNTEYAAVPVCWSNLRHPGLFAAAREDKRALAIFCGSGGLEEPFCGQNESITLGFAPRASIGCRLIHVSESGNKPSFETKIVPYANRSAESSNHQKGV